MIVYVFKLKISSRADCPSRALLTLICCMPCMHAWLVGMDTRRAVDAVISITISLDVLVKVRHGKV